MIRIFSSNTLKVIEYDRRSIIEGFSNLFWSFLNPSLSLSLSLSLWFRSFAPEQLPQWRLNQLRLVQKKRVAVRLILHHNTKHITTVLFQLHRLAVRFRSVYNIPFRIIKARSGTAPLGWGKLSKMRQPATPREASFQTPEERPLIIPLYETLVLLSQFLYTLGTLYIRIAA